MKYRLQATGITPLVLHNERLADPLDEFTRAIGAISKKRNKAEEDHRNIGRLEFLGGLYTEPPLEPNPNGHKYKIGVPGWNVLRCLQDGAKRQKRGADVPRGVHLLPDNFAVLKYEGPDSPEEMWKEGPRFALRKTVGIQRSRTMRTRPIFTDWEFELDVEIDPTIFDLHVLQTAWTDAGRYYGLGEMRPIYGRFHGEVEVL
jgi:hypothetical protein